MESLPNTPKFPQSREGIAQLELNHIPLEEAAHQLKTIRGNFGGDRAGFTDYIEGVSEQAAEQLSLQSGNKRLTAYSLLAPTWEVGQELDDKITKSSGMKTGYQLVEPVVLSIEPTLNVLLDKGYETDDEYFLADYLDLVGYEIESRAGSALSQQPARPPKLYLVESEELEPLPQPSTQSDNLRKKMQREAVKQQQKAERLYDQLKLLGFDKISETARHVPDFVATASELKQTSPEQFKAVAENLRPVVELTDLNGKRALYPNPRARKALALVINQDPALPLSAMPYREINDVEKEETFLRLLNQGWRNIADFKQRYDLT